MKRLSIKNFLRIIGIIIIGVASILTLGVILGVLQIQYLSSSMLQKLTIFNSLDGIAISGLSEQSAIWFGGIIIAGFFLIGSFLVVKTRNVA